MREWLNKNRNVTIAGAGALVAAAVALVVVQVMAARRGIATRLPDAFYTTDDGATYFVANMENVPPYEHQGKQAVRAHVFEYKGKSFVGYLERYTVEGRKAMMEKRSNPATQLYHREVKKPGEAKWVNVSDTAAAAKIVDVRAPDGSDGEPEPLGP
jgi:hypothetical protein